jgi:hypothetical protein
MFPEALITPVKATAASFELDPAFVAAIVMCESNGNRFKTRYEPLWRYLNSVDSWAKRIGVTSLTETNHQSTSWGLMQIMGGTARGLGFAGYFPELAAVEIGLRYGCDYLSTLRDKIAIQSKLDNSLPALAAAYNAGEVKYDPETDLFVNQNYVDCVMGYHKALSNIFTASTGVKQ